MPSRNTLPQAIQRSLLEAEKDPDAVLSELEHELPRSPQDPVLYLKLAVTCRQKGLLEEALEAAWRASVFAPGSALMRSLPYYIAHPDGFDAPAPPEMHDGEPSVGGRVSMDSSGLSLPDLDEMIDKLLNLEHQGRIRIGQHEDAEAERGRDRRKSVMEEPSEDGELGLASLTLVDILGRQGKHAQALALLERIMARDDGSGNREQFEARRQALREAMKGRGGEGEG